MIMSGTWFGGYTVSPRGLGASGYKMGFTLSGRAPYGGKYEYLAENLSPLFRLLV